MEGRLASSDMAFDGYDADDEQAAAPAHFLASPVADPADIVVQEDTAADQTMRLASGLKDLDERSRDILERRWLMDDKATLHELADEYGVSAERIRQIEKNAMKKLKKAFARV